MDNNERRLSPAPNRDGHGPLRMPNAPGLRLMSCHGEYLLFNEEERIAVLTVDQLAHLHDLTWAFLYHMRHEIVSQPLPTSIYNRPDGKRAPWWPEDPTE